MTAGKQLKVWPATSSRLICVPVHVFRQRIRTQPVDGVIPVVRACSDCGRACVTSVLSLVKALVRPGRDGRPLRPICIDCRENYLH